MNSTDPTSGSTASPVDPPAPPADAPAVGAAPPGRPRGELVDAVRAVVADARGPIVVGASGGPDSAGLLRLTADAAGTRPVQAVHVRHGLRDDAADRDLARAQAVAVGAGFVEMAVTVEPDGDGLAAAARRARLDALVDAAARLGADTVLLGHTADDRAETILLNVARGAGPAGLAAMPAVRVYRGVRLAHPLRSVRRADVRAVAGHGPPVADDPTNADWGRRRTRVRHAVVPALAALSGGGGDVVAALTRLGDLAADDAAALDAMAARAAARLRGDWGPVAAIDAAGLAELPVALARRVVRAALTDVAGATPCAAAVERTRTLAPGQRETVTAAVAVARQGRWLLARPEAVAALPTVEVAAPGEAVVAALDVRVRVRGRDARPVAGADAAPPAGPPRSVPGPVGVAGAAAVRPRRPGDRIVLEGVERSVTEVLRRAGVPGLVRDLVPLVADDDGRIAGIVGVAGADGAATMPWRVGTEPVATAPVRDCGEERR